jgi:hypothetical protein
LLWFQDRISQQPKLHDAPEEFCTIGSLKPFIEALEDSLDAALRQTERYCDIGVASSFGEELQYLNISRTNIGAFEEDGGNGLGLLRSRSPAKVMLRIRAIRRHQREKKLGFA